MIWVNISGVFYVKKWRQVISIRLFNKNDLFPIRRFYKNDLILRHVQRLPRSANFHGELLGLFQLIFLQNGKEIAQRLHSDLFLIKCVLNNNLALVTDFENS